MKVRRRSGLKLDVWTAVRGPAWFAPTPRTTRLTCSNMLRQSMFRLKAIIAHSVRNSAQILSHWRTTNHAVPTKAHELLFELLFDSNTNGVDFALHTCLSQLPLAYTVHLSDLWSLICCISATTVAHTAQDKEYADGLIRSKLEMNPDTRLWCCKECPYNHHRNDVMKKHVDAQHMAIQYSCYICLKLSPTQHALKQHQASQHK